MSQQAPSTTISTYWTGTCPACELKNERGRMRLNDDDFYECEECHLQIVITAQNVLATILNFRGTGKYRRTVEYADQTPITEILCPQTIEDYPFNDHKIFHSSEEIAQYIQANKLDL